MTDKELNAATEGLQFMLDGYRDKNSWEGYPRMLRDGIAAITTLRAQLAEAEACNRGLVRLNEAIQARAERAEAALAVQIEVDAGMIDAITAEASKGVLLGCTRDRAVLDMMKSLSAAIRNQPHDRTALDRVIAQTREKALREAADELRGQGYGAAIRTIPALIEKEKTE